MAIYILPTGNVFNMCERYENLFSFYDNGLQGLIKDVVLVVDGIPRKTGRKECPHVSDLKNKILSNYQNSSLGVMAYITENTSHDAYLDIAIDDVMEMINEMLFDHFRGKYLRICNENIKWLQKDLMIDLITRN